MRRLFVIACLLTFTHLCPAAEYQRFEENGKIGLKDNQGNVVLPASFDALGWSDGSFSVIGQITGYRRQNLWGLLNLKKEFITGALYESLTYSGGNRVIAGKMTGPFTLKIGCLDLQGKIMIPFAFDAIKTNDQRAVVMIKKNTRYEYGLTDLQGNSILPAMYQKIEPVGSLRYVVQDFKNKSALCTEQGKWVTEFFIDSISSFQHDLAILHQGWKKGVIDRNGEIKVNPAFRELKITGPSDISARKTDQWKVVDNKNSEILNMEADGVFFGKDGWNRVLLNGKWGFMDDQFRLRWEIAFDFLGPIENKKTIVKSAGKYKLLRLDQTSVLEGSFDSLCVDQSFIRALRKEAGRSAWILYDTFGIRKTLYDYEFLGMFNGKFFPVKKRGYWGGVDRYGHEKIACVYDSLLNIHDDLLAVNFHGLYGIINLEDQWKLPPQSLKAIPVAQDRFVEKSGSLLFLKDFRGNVFYFTDNQVGFFSDFFVEFSQDGTMKKINYDGQIINRVTPFMAGTIQEQFRESEGFIGIRRDGKYGFVDTRGRLRIANRYEAIGEFHEGLAAVKLLGKWGFIDPHDQIVIQPTFEMVQAFHDGIALAVRGGKYGIIGTDGKALLELRYDSIKKISENHFLLKLNNLYGLADGRGRVLIEPRFEFLQIIPQDRVMVSQDHRYGLLTADGMSLFPLQYNKMIYWHDRDEFLIHDAAAWTEIKIN